MKEKLKKVFRFIANPRLLFCFGLAWIVTNGWSYILLGMGTWLDIGWMKAVAGGYIAFLWLPFSQEKIVTVAIAVALLRLLFPNDRKTLAVLKEMSEKLKTKRKERNARKKEKEIERDRNLSGKE